MKRHRLYGFAVTVLVASLAMAEMSPPIESAKRIYRLRFESQLQPLKINQIHSWQVRVETVDGEPLRNAALTMTGGMPAHDHGLPTAPRVTREMGDGEYLIEGVRFHMGGYWEITIKIDAGGTTDFVTVPLDL